MNKLNENDVAALKGEITHTANALRSRELPFLDGVRRLNALGHEVSPTGPDADFVIFVVVDSDTDHIPNVGARAMCAQTWLDQCDNEVKEVEEFYGQEVDAACEKLIVRFSNGATGCWSRTCSSRLPRRGSCCVPDTANVRTSPLPEVPLMRVLLLLVFMFSLSCWAAESNPPTPSAAQGQQNKGDAKQNPKAKQEPQSQQTPAAPVGITVVATGGNTPQPQGGEGKAPEWGAVIVASLALIVACGALFVAFRQMGMFKAQLGHMKDALDHSGVMSVAAEKSADAALKQAAYLQQSARAYVFAESSKPLSLRKEKLISATVDIKNFGQTPAIDVTSTANIGIYPYPLTAPLRPQAFPNASKSPLGPSQFMTQFPTLDELFTEAHTNAIVAKQAAIYVWGEIVYLDVFNIKRHTAFCLYCTGDDIDGGNLAYYPDGNKAD